MFNGARNVVINDGVFTVNADSSSGVFLDRLIDEVAPNAILNAGGRADEVRCFPGTRKEVIGKVEKWIDGEGPHPSRMMWLSGPAGAGKSAICQTVAERCQARGVHAANFFFFRGDGTRNHAQPLVATLAYQLLEVLPPLNELLVKCLKVKPLICKAPIGEQLMRLISSPIQTLQQSRSIILIIDGLDECDDARNQEHILEALHGIVEENNSPLRVLVSSRAEPHLVMSFNKITTVVESIFLNDDYRPQSDIRRFVTAKLHEIKRVHSLAHTLDECWPEETDIDAITDKSSGQFIYAATVVRFIQYSPSSPAISLLRVKGMRPATSHSPLAQLDAVYSYIFSKTRDIQTVKLLVGCHFIIQRGWLLNTVWEEGILFRMLLKNAGYETIDIESFLADLAPIVRFDRGPPMKLVFYHASLAEYLLNEARSGIYYMDVESIAAEWVSIFLNKMDHLNLWVLAVGFLEHVNTTNEELSMSLLNACAQSVNPHGVKSFINMGSAWQVLMGKLYKLYFESERALYRRMLRRWIRFAYINHIDMAEGMADTFNARGYYAWCLLTERIKLAFRPHTST